MRKYLQRLSLVALLGLAEISCTQPHLFKPLSEKLKEEPSSGSLVDDKTYSIDLNDLGLGEGEGKIVVKSKLPPLSKDGYPTNNWLNHYYFIYDQDGNLLYSLLDDGPRIHHKVTLRLGRHSPAIIFAYNGLRNSNGKWLYDKNIDNCIDLSQPERDPASIIMASYNGEQERIILTSQENIVIRHLCNGYNLSAFSISRDKKEKYKLDLNRVHTTCTVCHGR